MLKKHFFVNDYMISYDKKKQKQLKKKAKRKHWKA